MQMQMLDLDYGNRIKDSRHALTMIIACNNVKMLT